jgi:Mn-dependent DtxR family transcriptional regulator
MTIWDDRILEIIRDDEDHIGKVSNISKEDGIHVSQPHVSRRCSKLADNGLLRPIGDGVYVITDEGLAYLDEEYDAEKGKYINGGGSSEESESADSPEEPGVNG